MPRFALALLGVALLLAGCAQSAAPTTPDEAQLRRAFEDFQSAFEGKRADKMWPLLDAGTQAAAERLADRHRAAHANEAAADKAARQKRLGLSAAEVDALTGAGYLNTRPFRDKYHDVPEYRIAKYAVTGDRATIDLTADDGDKDRFELARAGTAWKLVLPMPAE